MLFLAHGVDGDQYSRTNQGGWRVTGAWSEVRRYLLRGGDRAVVADLLPVLVVCLCSGARLVRVFVYEAYALVLASSLMGVIIGVLVGWTFSQQRSLFTQVGGCGRLRVCVALNLHGLVTTTTAPCFLLGTVAHRGCHHDRVRRVFRAGSSYPRPLLVEDANHRVAPHGGVAPAQYQCL